MNLRKLRAGDLIRAVIPYSSKIVRGSVLRVERNNDLDETIMLTPIVSGGSGPRLNTRIPYSSIETYFEQIPTEHESIISVSYLARLDEKGNLEFFDTREPSGSVPSNITFENLAALFKYIPIKYKNLLGFYYKGNMILKTTSYKKEPRYDLKRGKYKNPILVEKIEFIPMAESDVLKYYSEETIKAFCKVKIVDYVKSSKLFKYSGEKKELLNKTLELAGNKQRLTFEILDIKLKDKLKTNDELQNTISIDGKTRKLRFVMEEVEIIYPNINGWAPTKDKTIKEGSTVKIKNNRHCRNVPKNQSVTIVTIKSVGNKVYAGFSHENKLIYNNIKNFKVL